MSAELEDLVDSFNRALDRVQSAYEHLEAFSADVAHELRTPLTTMISATEVELARERTVAELRDTLSGNLESLHQLTTMVNDMLFLARADQGGTAQTLAVTDLRLVAG
ncbi:histidine kinase dimerization/phospho-acceptor domain-containing protein, partial [Escherichia coli]|uniref:histidine kinase dimerization/phospho-acceptor domain-containing protein n=2 Tax=Escherichia coli TaxID=562 RepID=UPI0025465405